MPYEIIHRATAAKGPFRYRALTCREVLGELKEPQGSLVHKDKAEFRKLAILGIASGNGLAARSQQWPASQPAASQLEAGCLASWSGSLS